MSMLLRYVAAVAVVVLIGYAVVTDTRWLLLVIAVATFLDVMITWLRQSHDKEPS